MFRRTAAALGAALSLFLVSALASTAHAQPQASGDVVVFSGPAHVGQGERSRSLIVLEGPTRIDGVVRGDVLALGGDVEVAGRVGGDVVALSGRVRVLDGAHVERDVVSRHAPWVASGARIGGTAKPIDARSPALSRAFGRFVSWLAVTASLFALALLLGWFVPRSASEAVYQAARERPLEALAAGLLFALGVPALAAIAAVTLLGLPLGVVTFFGIGLLSSLGYVTCGWLVGRGIADAVSGVRRLPPLALWLVGVVCLRFLAFAPAVGPIAWILASSFGAGAVILAVRQARARLASPTTPAPDAPATPPLASPR